MTSAELAAGAQTVPCPRCPAGVGESCQKPNGDDRATHVDRIKAYRAEVDRARRKAEGDATERIEHPRWRRVYIACRLELENRAAWTLLAAEQLESMVLNMAEAELARARSKSEPTTEGSMGQKVPNPAVQIALRYDAQALATARALKLTPDTRGTSVEVPDGGEDPTSDASPEEECDELAAIDLMAERAKRAGKTSKGSRKRATK